MATTTRFRAWDKANKIMRLNDEIVIWNNQVYINEKKKLDSKIKGYSFLPEYLMQSTGLFDKNGDDIFESDIVEWEHKDTGQLVRGVVKYDTEFGLWGMTDVRFNDLTAIGYLSNQRVTVLGNIYQNKELVEE